VSAAQTIESDVNTIKNWLEIQLHRCLVDFVDLRTDKGHTAYVVVEGPLTSVGAILRKTLGNLGYRVNDFAYDIQFPDGIEVKVDLAAEYEKAVNA